MIALYRENWTQHHDSYFVSGHSWLCGILMCVVIIINTLLQVSQVLGFEITPFVQVLMCPKATTCFANYCFKKATVVKTEKIKSLV